MSKHKNLSKFLKKIYYFINSLIPKNSKKFDFNEVKLKIKQFFNIKRVFISLITILILNFLYLCIPFFYDKSKIQNHVKNQLLDKHEIKFIFSSDMKYNLFPKPSYTFKNVQILDNKIKLASIDKLKINLEIRNFFTLNNLKIKNILLTNAKFNIYKKNYKFFFNLLNNDFSRSDIKIINSYIFFKDNEDDVLFINKINLMNYYYDAKKDKNILDVKNEIFNIPYSLELYDDKKIKRIFSEIKINTFKSIFGIELDYGEKTNKGEIFITNNKNKSKINFKLDEKKLVFEFFDKIKDPDFMYSGDVYLKPFYFDLIGELKKINLNNLKDPNSLFVQFLKTEIFNNQNLNILSIIDIKKVLPYQKIIDLLINFRIKEGLVDLDESKFSWSNFADFKISNSLIYLSDNTLVFDGTMNIDVFNYNEIYKFFQTPRNYRKEINNLKFVFSYNFDKEIINISNLQINDQINQKVNVILNQLVSQENLLQNRIYFKNLINKAIKAYSG
tara:strand:- start:1680 stop:3182 length:1503 start_codon:yes stop_codon:yes gene_type:complete